MKTLRNLTLALGLAALGIGAAFAHGPHGQHGQQGGCHAGAGGHQHQGQTQKDQTQKDQTQKDEKHEHERR